MLFWCRLLVYFWERESRQPFSRWLEDAVQRRRHSGFPWWDRPPGRSILSAASWVFCPVHSPSLDWGHPVLFARAVRLPLRSHSSSEHSSSALRRAALMALACSLKGSTENPSMLIWLAKLLWKVFRPHRRFVSSYHLFGFSPFRCWIFSS